MRKTLKFAPLSVHSIKYQSGFLLIFLGLLLAGCDGCDTYGIRNVGVFPQSNYPKSMVDATVLVAVDEYYGYCAPITLISKDGGLTWRPDRVDEFKGAAQSTSRLISGNCSDDCYLLDAYTDLIQYHIRPGKILEQSLDGRETWQEELRVPAWSLMEQNFVKSRFPSEESRASGGIRGPFSAVTDPKTGNLVVAMGFEGLLVRGQDNAWTWVEVQGFHRLQVTRSEMLSLIDLQEWLRVLFILLTLLLIGLRRMGFAHSSCLGNSFLAVGGVFILIPHTGIAMIPLILTFIIPNTYERFAPVAWAIPLPVLLGLAIMAVPALVRAAVAKPRPAKVLTLRAALFALGYMVPFLLWSQGMVFSEYWHASLTGVAIVLCGYALLVSGKFEIGN